MSSGSDSRGHDLRLDRVVSSQPELGPSVPDGGYGWLVLMASSFLQVVIPSIIVGYGMLMIIARIENGTVVYEPALRDVNIIYAPILFVAFWTLSDPWSRTLVTSSTWPRLVATAGICFTCAGLLINWIAIKHQGHVFYYMLAGILSGIGASITITQADTLVGYYFRLKLRIVSNITYASFNLGFVIVPLVLSSVLVRRGIMQGILIYQTIILQGLVAIIVFKKPEYLKAERRRYKLLQSFSDDDEPIFAKDTELRNSRASEEEAATSSSTSQPNGVANPQPEQQKSRRDQLLESFSSDFGRDLGHVENPDAPEPIYGNNPTANSSNSVYTYDNNDVPIENDTVVIFTAPDRIVHTDLKHEISFLCSASFYKSLLLLITHKITMLIFWVFYPSYLYAKLDELKVQEVGLLVAVTPLGSLLFSSVASCLPTYGSRRALCLSIFCWIGAIGYVVLAISNSEGWLLFAGIHISLSITAIHALSQSVLKQTLGPEAERAHTLLCTLTGIAILLILVQDMSFTLCFKLLSLLYFVTGSVWFTSALFARMKKLFSRQM